ncbi:MAG: hypothetical protein JJT78_18355 [Leptospira sp.]|nr:hypothetical protein [Leptospira sp.]
MEFNITHIYKSGERSFNVLMLWVFRVCSFLFPLILVLAMFLDRNLSAESLQIMTYIWMGIAGLMSLIFIIIRFDLDGIPPQGVIYRLDSDTLIVETHNRKGKKLKETIYPLKDLDFFHGGPRIQRNDFGQQSGRSTRGTVNTPVTGMYAKRKVDNTPTQLFQIFGMKAEIIEELRKIADHINKEIARVQGISLNALIEKMSKTFEEAEKTFEFTISLEKAKEDRKISTPQYKNKYSGDKQKPSGIIWIDYLLLVWMWGVLFLLT